MRLFNVILPALFSTPANRRLADLAQVLEQMAVEIAVERASLKDAYDNAIAQAAFAFEALEQGEGEANLPARIDALSETLDEQSRRFQSLKEQADFVEATRRRLELLQSDEWQGASSRHTNVTCIVN